MNRLDITKEGNGEKSMRYKTDNMEKCEYIDSMRKVYFDKPKQHNDKCEGYRNKYNNRLSQVCENCQHRGDINDDE